MTDPNQPPPYPQPSQPAPTYNVVPAPAPNAPVPGKTLGIVAFVGALVLSFLSLVWLVLGIVALVKSRKAGRGNGFAVAAIIISIVAFIVWVIVAVSVIVGIVTIAQLCAQYGSGVYEINGQDVTLSCG